LIIESEAFVARHCEERSDEAIQCGGSNLIAPIGILSGLLRFARNDGSVDGLSCMQDVI
jgi:hypothetical protein